jgi:transcriptional regulator with XRE-family HTH domain
MPASSLSDWPFCHLRLTAPMPPPRGYPRVFRTLGDHLKKVRLDRELEQDQVARELGASVQTLINWEKNHTRVSTRFVPRVVAFLGYDPRGEAGQIGDRIRMLRERQGLSQAALAAKLDLNASTVTAWERGRVRKLFPAVQRRFEEFLSGG